jgi:hypothetical protein
MNWHIDNLNYNRFNYSNFLFKIATSNNVHRHHIESIAVISEPEIH